ncbi:hypothetical protein L3073_04815 [Ancylomarina sp. DW003]|nr:hypothetical protein [Ancylomarina sp. DW003]MDE5421518.1 hypothetical protein [Ancylomarina sp. DW003]
MATKKSAKKCFWIPINIWNLNELFTTESISPISFYRVREFGNPVNRNQEKVEDPNKLILFDNVVKSDILLKISPDLLNFQCLTEIKSNKKAKLKSFEYSKTIYLKSGLFNVYFSNQGKLDEFLNNTFMLLEVKSVNKYKSDFVIDETISTQRQEATYQQQLMSEENKVQPFFDKAFNQIKGLIYGYLIGSIGTLGEKEQGLISSLSKLKNAIGGIHTDIVMVNQYSNFWIINVRKQIKDCHKSYSDNFGKQSDILELLLLRLEEIDSLNIMRCSDLEKQSSPNYKRDYETEQERLEKAKRELYKYESKYEIAPLREELERIKQDEKNKGIAKGKTREYYKKDSYEFNRKQELKRLINDLENEHEYQELKKAVGIQIEKVRNFQFGFTQYDTSITEQFSRISEQLYEIIKRTTSSFLSKSNQSNDFSDISFEIDISKLTNFYCNPKTKYADFSVKFPEKIVERFTKTELKLLTVSINSLLSQPQGQLGNFSEQNILDVIKSIGEHLPESLDKQILRDYYMYRDGKNDNFIFPENIVLGNLIVFLMKLNGHEQINKMLLTKNIEEKYIAFMFYGAYVGFANMPKTFTNIVFDSNNSELTNGIDNYLFSNVLMNF